MTNSHAIETRRGLEHVKKLVNSLDGWEFLHEKEGVKVYNKPQEDSALPLLIRGDTTLDSAEGCTPREYASSTILPGCRKIWDPNFEWGELVERYSRDEIMVWLQLKAPWPISARDLAITSVRETDEDVIYLSMVSVQDDQIPPKSGYVRGNLMLSGWKIWKQDQGLGVIFVNQIDLAGSLPSVFLRTTQQDAVLAAGRAARYIQANGFPPSAQVSDEIKFKEESFDHAKHEYVFEAEGTGTAECLASSKMYPGGVKVNVDGSATPEIVDAPGGHLKVLIKDIQGHIVVRINRK
ncbi:hypothetical protein DFQ28_002293 [Apophysomyces sp. BC1034]|nr:hypothetical protein DFQ30_003558 [Apophysomyces sp. BC1015]KAG0178997.1 hypothetical protein DFQ29_002739 [Apophysomyces sp. BC1021]KAG0190256.1 hypothetical protein DFQ28_002293 [Apophysomyces sp. BC1034]